MIRGATLLRPELLWSLPALLLLLIVWRLIWRRRYVGFSTLRLFASLRHRPSIVRRIPGLLILFALGALVMALTDPVVPRTESEVTSQGLDIVVVLDLSSSMQELMGGTTPANSLAKLTYTSRDGARKGPAARTRLETVKEAIRKFIKMRRDDRLALVVFSDHAYVISPLTFDHDHLDQYIDIVDDQILRGEGMTAIGDGISLANYMIAKQSAKNIRNKVIIVFTDGEHNFGRDPIEALDDSDQAGIRVHMIGVDIQQEIRLKPAVTNLIKAIRQMGGRYYTADTTRQLAAASAELDTLEKGLLTNKVTIRNAPVYHWFVVPAILLLVAALVLRAVPFFADFT